MRLTLYHNDRTPYVVLNVIKLSVDNTRTLAVTIKERRFIEYKSFRYQVDYQRLTIQVD